MKAIFNDIIELDMRHLMRKMGVSAVAFNFAFKGERLYYDFLEGLN